MAVLDRAQGDAAAYRVGAPAQPRGRAWFDRAEALRLLKWAGLVTLAAAYLILAARSVVDTNYAYGRPMLALLLAFGPLAAYFALRAPAFFPMGAYLVLVPFDAILAVMSGVTLTRLLGVATAAALGTRMFTKRRILTPPSAWWAWLLWIGWTSLTFLWTPDVAGARVYFGQFFQSFLLMTIFAVYPFTRFEFKFTLGVIVATGWLGGLYTLWKLHSETFVSRVSISTTGGYYVDPNYFAGSFIIPVALALTALLFTRSLFQRALALASLTVMLVPLFLSQSRSGFVSLIALFLYIGLRSRRRLQILFAIGGVLALSSLTPIWGRFLHDPTLGNGSGRTEIWLTALSSIQQHWLFGAGVGSFVTVYDRGILTSFQPMFQMWNRPAHSLVVGVVTETGVIGLALVLIAWYQSFRQSRVVKAGSEFYPVRLAFEGAILALFINSLFLDPVFVKYVWLANALPLMLSNVVLRTRASPAPARPLTNRLQRA